MEFVAVYDRRAVGGHRYAELVRSAMAPARPYSRRRGTLLWKALNLMAPPTEKEFEAFSCEYVA